MSRGNWVLALLTKLHNRYTNPEQLSQADVV